MSTISLPAQFPSRAISSTKKKVAKLTVWPLVAATFFMVSGGTYGTEDIIHGAGYGLGILLLLLTPLVWSLPTTYMIGELSSALPSEGGYYAWVRRALGNFWGFQEAWLSLVASIFDMAIYPTLFVAYLTRLFPWFAEGHRGVMVGLAVVTVCALMNIAGIRVVAISSLWLFFLLSLPFVLIVLIAPMQIGALKDAVTSPTSSSVGLIGGLLICMWNYMGWDNASTIATEVRRPQRTYPKAMLIAVLVVAATYILPFAAMWLTGISSAAFETGSWADLAGMMGTLVGGPVAGRIFRAALVLGGMMSAFGMFNALVMSYSRLPLAMAQDGMLPAVFAKLQPKTRAPWVSIIVLASAWAMCLGLGFERLVTLDIMLYGMSLSLEFLALVALRIKEPNLRRPFRVPGGTVGAVLIGVFPILLLGFAMVHSEGERILGMSGLAFGALLIAGGFLTYWATAPLRRLTGASQNRRKAA
ncbi:MAG TPA: APC family permease [Candidatus Acidoferrales bacterium]|nr:APC family permease [Candidatus Acidoferrales bacterium]